MSTQRIGKYEVVREIGTGGYGRVLQARDPVIERYVAIKVCTSVDPAVRERFLREAQLAGLLDHPSIVTIYDFGETEDGPYLVQEYLDGHDLSAHVQRIHRGTTIPDERRLEWLRGLAEALDHAHKQGVLHRDVKPANVRVLEDDRIKLLDFGIARMFGAETQLTESGKVIGTAGYLAPEQATGGEVTARTDVFAFGVIAYELLSGRHPFPGSGLTEVLDRVMAASPQPFDELRPDLPRSVRELVRRCLMADPEGRPAGFAEIVQVLDPDSTGTGTGTGITIGPGALHATADVTSAGASPVHTVLLPPTPPPPPKAAPVAAPPSPKAPKAPIHDTAELPVPPAHPPAGGSRPDDTAPKRRPPWIWAVAAVLLLAVAGLAWWVLSGRRPEPPVAETPTRPAPTTTAPASADPQGQLRVSTVPWGQVVRVTDPDGAAVSLPEDATTPLTLALPPGIYEVELTHPDLESNITCAAVVVADGTGTPTGSGCPEQLVTIGPLEYFREVGWWR